MFSVLLTFGGIYLTWKGMEVFSFVVMISGGAMTMGFVLSVSSIWVDFDSKTK